MQAMFDTENCIHADTSCRLRLKVCALHGSWHTPEVV